MNYDIHTEDGRENSRQWTRCMMSCIKDGGAWLIPRSGTIVHISHSKKSVTIRRGFHAEPEVADIIAELGYSVSYDSTH